MIGKINLAILIAFYGVLTGIPVAIYIGYVTVPDGQLDSIVRYGVHGFAFVLSYPLYLMGVLVFTRNPVNALYLTMSGTAIRFFGIMIIAAWVMLNNRAILRPVILLYFISIASFLFFELVSIIGLHFYARKKKNHIGILMKRNRSFILTTFVIITMLFSSGTIFAENAAEGHGEESGYDLQAVLSHHLMDSPVLELNIGGRKVYEGEEGFAAAPFVRSYVFHDEKGAYRWEGGVPLHLTRRVTMMFLVSVILVAFFIFAARKIASDPLKVNGRFAGVVESLVQFVREEIAENNMHHHSKGFQPYILTVFFFILFANMLGLFPPVGELLHMGAASVGLAEHGHGHDTPFLVAMWPGMTITGDVAVTLTLSVFTTLMIWVTGFRYQGVKFLWHVVPGGVPAPLFPLMWFLEFLISPLAKGFALTVRLLANMTGGHVIILVLIGFIFQFQSLFVVPVAVGGAAIIYLLEIFVAFLQAFIFALLSALFIGQMMHRH